jgi:hypothetical protein
VLHIHSGDCSADAAAQAGVPGAHLPWREALVEGPVAQERRRLGPLRRDYLLQRYGEQAQSHDHDFGRVLEAIDSNEADLNLWFDEDLFCQVNLWFLLHEMSARSTRRIMLRGKPLEREELRSGADAWMAYCSSDPRVVEREILVNASAAAPLRLHLTRYPSTRNGLGAIEQRLLEFVADGASTFADLFRQFLASMPEFGFGDAQVWLELSRLSNGAHPLVHVSGSMTEGRIALAPHGAEVLAARKDSVDLNGIDVWLGGVRLAGATTPWRWDGNCLIG